MFFAEGRDGGRRQAGVPDVGLRPRTDSARESHAPRHPHRETPHRGLVPGDSVRPRRHKPFSTVDSSLTGSPTVVGPPRLWVPLVPPDSTLAQDRLGAPSAVDPCSGAADSGHWEPARTPADTGVRRRRCVVVVEGARGVWGTGVGVSTVGAVTTPLAGEPRLDLRPRLRWPAVPVGNRGPAVDKSLL